MLLLSCDDVMIMLEIKYVCNNTFNLLEKKKSERNEKERKKYHKQIVSGDIRWHGLDSSY